MPHRCLQSADALSSFQHSWWSHWKIYQCSCNSRTSKTRLRFHFNVTCRSRRVHFDVTSISLRCHFDVGSISLKFQMEFTSMSLRLHFDLTSTSLRLNFGIASKSLSTHIDFTATSQWERGKCITTQWKTENLAMQMGKGRGAQVWLEIDFHLTTTPCAHTHDRFPSWTHIHNLRFLYL